MDRNLKISNNFNLNEFLVSESFPDIAQNMNIDVVQEARIVLLVHLILQRLREELNTPIKILSGYRNSELNKLVGGGMDSDHTYAIAADFTCKGVMQAFLHMYYMRYPYRQLIYYPDEKFIHVSINKPGRDFKNEAFVKYKSDDTYHKFSVKDNII